MAGQPRSPGDSQSGRSTPKPQHSHVVLFRDTGAKNVSALSSKLKLSAPKRVAAAEAKRGVSTLSSERGVKATVFSKLGVAAVSGTPEQLEEIRQMDEVEGVFANELRSIPRPVVTAATPSAGRVSVTGSGTGGSYAYLYGLRDGIDMAIGALGGAQLPAGPRSLAAAAAARFADTNTLTWGLQALDISAAANLTGLDVPVCVLDTGVDFGHPDFRDRFADGDTRSFVPDEPDAQDAEGHGTHCCGTVASVLANAADRRYGVAPRAKLIVGKVLNSRGEGYDEWIIQGIDWAITQNARVISMSLGSARSVGEAYSPLYERLAERALQARPGTIIVAAAGNESDRPAMTAPVGNPAACPSILSIAACDGDLAVAWFSCRQMDGIGAVDLAGPGVDVYSTALGGGYRKLSGTSMATPHIAGLAALWLETYPDMTASELWDRLKAAAKPIGDSADFGAGLARVPAAR